MLSLNDVLLASWALKLQSVFPAATSPPLHPMLLSSLSLSVLSSSSSSPSSSFSYFEEEASFCIPCSCVFLFIFGEMNSKCMRGKL